MVKKPHQKVLSPRIEDMLSLETGKLQPNTSTDFDLYLNLGGKVTLYAVTPYEWTKAELDRLKGQGHEYFYHFKTDQKKLEAYLSISVLKPLDLKGPPAKRVVSLTDAAAEFTRVLYDHPLSAQAMARGKEIAKGMVMCMIEDPTCVTALGKLANHDHYTYYHSARVAAYALAIALQLTAHDEEHLQEIASGCLLHDIGKSRIGLDILNKEGALTKDEWELMRRHPEFGDKLVDESILSMIPRHIIMHHHERMDGTGYPHSLMARELLEEVKIASFADVFDALTTNRPYQPSRSRYEALDFIKHNLVKNLHYDSFAAMVQILKAGELKAANVRKVIAQAKARMLAAQQGGAKPDAGKSPAPTARPAATLVPKGPAPAAGEKKSKPD